MWIRVWITGSWNWGNTERDQLVLSSRLANWILYLILRLAQVCAVVFAPNIIRRFLMHCVDIDFVGYKFGFLTLQIPCRAFPLFLIRRSSAFLALVFCRNYESFSAGSISFCWLSLAPPLQGDKCSPEPWMRTQWPYFWQNFGFAKRFATSTAKIRPGSCLSSNWRSQICAFHHLVVGF